jgi:hypothetical protein
MKKTTMILNGMEIRDTLNFKKCITSEATIVYHNEGKTVHIVPVEPNIRNTSMSKYVVTLTTE